MEQYQHRKQYKSILDELYNNLNIHHLADSNNHTISQCDEHTINQVASARAFLFLEKFCGKDGRLRAFNQIDGSDGITNYKVNLDDVNFFKLHYCNHIGFVLTDGLSAPKIQNKFVLNFFHPYKKKFDHTYINRCEISKKGSNDVLLERTGYLNNMRLAA